MVYDAFNNLTQYVKPGKDAADVYKITYGAEEIRKKRHLPITTETPEGVKTVSSYGKLLTHKKKGTDEMHFFYDAQTRPTMVEYNEEKYHYLHNLQGDIVGIIDSNGAKVVKYKYNAWGKPVNLITLTSAYDIIANLNPFRYRGYVWDEENGWYYLRSRYHNPEWGRFINADVLLGKTGRLLSHNAFAYCRNNPILRVDSSGTEDWVAVTLIGYLHKDLNSNSHFELQFDFTHTSFIVSYAGENGFGRISIRPSSEIHSTYKEEYGTYTKTVMISRSKALQGLHDYIYENTGFSVDFDTLVVSEGMKFFCKKESELYIYDADNGNGLGNGMGHCVEAAYLLSCKLGIPWLDPYTRIYNSGLHPIDDPRASRANTITDSFASSVISWVDEMIRSVYY